MTIVALFTDGDSGEVIAAVRDDSHGSHTHRLNNRMNNASEIRSAFSTWARQFRTRLDILISGDLADTK